MRIPPYYRKPTWQQFFAGMVIGGCISWFIFLFIFGEWQEEYSKEMKKQEIRIDELTDEKKIWQDEFEKANEENQKKLTIQHIYVKISSKDKDKYHLDQFSVFELEEQVKEDIGMMKAKDIDTVYNSRELIKKIIENKSVPVNEKKFKLKVKEMTIYTTLSIELELILAD